MTFDLKVFSFISHFKNLRGLFFTNKDLPSLEKESRSESPGTIAQTNCKLFLKRSLNYRVGPENMDRIDREVVEL